MPADQWRRIRGEQEIVVRYEPEKALATLPKLLTSPADRAKLVTLVRRLLMDERVQRTKATTRQLSMVEDIGETLRVAGARRVREVAEGAKASKVARKRTTRKRKA